MTTAFEIIKDEFDWAYEFYMNEDDIHMMSHIQTAQAMLYMAKELKLLSYSELYELEEMKDRIWELASEYGY